MPRCEVCNEPIVDTDTLPPEIQDEIYRPGIHDQKNVELKLGPTGGFEDVTED
jgi:hypothetical protein